MMMLRMIIQLFLYPLRIELWQRSGITMLKRASLCMLWENSSLFSDSLVWWKAHVAKFPHVWLLVSVVLAIPATSAPLECVFSAAANIFHKK